MLEWFNRKLEASVLFLRMLLKNSLAYLPEKAFAEMSLSFL